MKKTAVLLLVFIFTSQLVKAQVELWGTISNNGQYGYGYIFKTDANGDHLQVVHHFDSLNGKSPKGLMMASNGKLYGLTSVGGQGNQGVLYEYDIVLSKFTVLKNFSDNPDFEYHIADTRVGLTEGSPGVLYGQAITTTSVPAPKGAVFAYTISTNTLSLALRIPTFMGGTWNDIQHNSLNGPLYKASDGYLYSTTARNSTCPVGSPSQGSIVRINPANNSYSVRYLNPCTSGDGFHYRTSFIEEGGKLYSIARGGIDFSQEPGHQYGNGILYEFNIATNAYIVKHVFQGGTSGFSPEPMTRADNGKWYGLAQGGTPQPPLAPEGGGIIYEYDPVSNNVTTKYNFLVGTSNVTEVGINAFGLLTKGTNGKLYGANRNGIFEYDVASTQVRAAARWPYGLGGYAYDPFLMELCRKPSYRSFQTSNYSLCEGSYFHHDLKCDNSTSVVWKRNGAIVASQTGTVLEFASVTTADAGTWVAELFNSCGSTVTPPIQIAVNSAGAGVTTSVLSPAGPHLICKGSSISLSGNNGGTWNTGATTSSISAFQPGSYQVSNTNACGTTYSNIVIVDTIPSPVAPVISGFNMYFCKGDSVLLSGNTNGNWNTGASSYSIYVKTHGTYFVVTSNQCTSDTSNLGVILPSFISDSLKPEITGDTIVCEGNSVPLSANDLHSTWWFTPDGETSATPVMTGEVIYASEAGSYFIYQSNMGCGTFRSADFHFYVEANIPPIPTINATGPLTFCEGESVMLESSVDDGLWNTGETTSDIVVSQSGDYYVSASNICGTSTSDPVPVTVNALPVVNYLQTPTSVCITDNAFQLSAASPSGGTYSGMGVNGNTFIPSAAGGGTHLITYSVTDANACSSQKTQSIVVLSPSDSPALLTASSTNSFCEGSSLLLYQTLFSSVEWSTGEIAPFIFVTEPGIYNYSVATDCGLVTSDSKTVHELPSPDVTVTQSGADLEANAMNATYQWVDCNNNNTPIANEVGKTFKAAADGSYAVIVTSGNCSKTSTCYPVTITAIHNSIMSNSISLFPNPAQDQLNLITEEEILSVEILNVTGQPVLYGNSKEVNISSLKAGSYFIMVETDKGFWRKKFTKL